MAEGHNNPSIARTLEISDAAVAKHIGNIFTKLDLPDADGHRRVLAVLTYLRS
jgi:DNA-binding NarL/FixJ family response regulator